MIEHGRVKDPESSNFSWTIFSRAAWNRVASYSSSESWYLLILSSIKFLTSLWGYWISSKTYINDITALIPLSCSYTRDSYFSIQAFLNFLGRTSGGNGVGLDRFTILSMMATFSSKVDRIWWRDPAEWSSSTTKISIQLEASPSWTSLSWVIDLDSCQVALGHDR